MKKVLVITAVLILVLSVTGCTKIPESKQIVTSTGEKPYLTELEVIGVAKKEAVNNPIWCNNNAKVAAYYAQGSGWNGKYEGAGKWIVELRLRSQDKASGDVR
jgi:hypothetical protein